MNRRAMILCLAVTVAAGAPWARSALSANADRHNFKIFGNSPLTSVRGVLAAGNPWVTDNSRIRLTPDGKLDLQIRGLVLAAGVNQTGGAVPPALVGTNPVAIVRIAVTWMVPLPAPGNPVFIQETGPLPLDPQGNLSARVQLAPPPPGAERPIILVRAGAAPLSGPFIASSDFVADWGAAHPDRHDE